MPVPPKIAPKLSGGANLLQLLQLAAAMQGPAQVDPPAAAEGAPDPSKFIREIVRASFSGDARGEKLRAAWRQIAAGALELVRVFSEEFPPEEPGP